MMLRIWLTSVGIGVICAWYAGLDPFSPYLYEWIILGCIAFAAGILMLTFGVLGSGLLVLMVTGALPLAMYYAEHLLARDIKPSNRFQRYTEDPPVRLETWLDHNHLYGRITNRHLRDWLRLAMVTCRPVYANGQPSERELMVSIGAGGWMAPGETTEALLASADGLSWRPGLAIERTQCWVAWADTYEAPAITPSFTYAKDAENRYVFEVTNIRRDANLTRVSFSRWVSFDGRRSKTDLMMQPLYVDGSTYIVAPGQSITLYNPETFPARQLSGCAVRDVSWQQTAKPLAYKIETLRPSSCIGPQERTGGFAPVPVIQTASTTSRKRTPPTATNSSYQGTLRNEEHLRNSRLRAIHPAPPGRSASG